MSQEIDSLEGVLIRPARKGDLSVLVDFMVKLALHVAGGTPQTLRKAEHTRLRDLLAAALADEDKLVIVAQAAQKHLVGMAYIHVWRSQGIWEQLREVEFTSAIIDDVWVEPEYRKLGVFRAMLAELVSFAEEHGAHELILEYSLSNQEADATWSKLGFQPTGVRAAAFTTAVRKALSESP